MSGMEIGGGMDRSSGPSGGGSSLPSPSPSPTAASTAPALVLSNSGRKIEQSAKKKYVKQVTGRHNDTDMHLAAQRGDLAAVRQILSDIDSQMIGTAGGAEFDAMVAEIRAAVVSEVNERGETALMIAAEKGYLDAVEELLKHADRESVARRSISGFDALHVAAKEGHQAVVQALLNYDPELSKTVGPSSVTPVMSAARNGHLAVVEELLSRNPSLLELTMTNGKNALHLAARYAHAEVVRALLSRNTQLARGIDKKRQTAVHMAAKGESTEVVNLLLAAAPETATQEDKFSNTALHVATRKKRVEIMKELLRVVASGGGVNALNRDGKTAMDLAEGLQASEETAAIKELLAAYGGLRAAELNQQSAMGDELRKTVTEIKKDVHTQLEQTWKTNKNVSGIAKELRKLHREGINNATNSAAPLLLLLICLLNQRHPRADGAAFVRVSGLHFTVNGSPFFANGFNAYWLMSVAADAASRSKVSTAFQEAASHGLTVCRTWAFSDGGFRALQISPGVYDEQVFRALDFVVAEASKHGIRVVLSFANNYESFGGKKQYVSWARARGQNVFSDDDFFSNPLVRFFFKNHVKAVIMRRNTLTGVMYRDDPTILAWELMNEPRCPSDPSGRTLQSWIEEMAAHVKSIDWNHLLEVGLEGFYGPAAPPQKRFLSGVNVGTNFISNNLAHGVDFATIHSYPDQWLSGSDHQTQLAFLERWLDAHIADARLVLRKPLLLAEFGISRKDLGFSPAQRDALFTAVYAKVYRSARAGGPAAGALFWHLLEPGMEVYGDGYEIVFREIPSSTASIIAEQGRRLRYLGKLGERLRNVEKLEKARAMNAQPSRSSVGDGG